MCVEIKTAIPEERLLPINVYELLNDKISYNDKNPEAYRSSVKLLLGMLEDQPDDLEFVVDAAAFYYDGFVECRNQAKNWHGR